ncbi:MAG: anti-sigma factor [Chloroflexi bacterium]|nr:anti-sigma factor [Chloroflexota bacterium]
MATNNPMNYPPDRNDEPAHPEDMLEAFALDALDLDEEERIQDHLDGCVRCSDAVDRYQETAAALARSVTPQDPPTGLRARLMQAVSREEPVTPDAPEPQLVPSIGDRLTSSRLVRVLVPMAASVAMVLVVLAVAMNVRISGQVDELRKENTSLQARLEANAATMTAQIRDAADAESRVMDTVLQLQQASYELARPDNMSLELSSPYAGSRAQGILLVSSDGSRGVIMVAGMEPPTPSTSYHVWLMRGKYKLWVGQVGVDSRGWGTVSLQLPESIMGFERVELTASASPNADQSRTDMVLEGNLVSMNAPRLVTYAHWR